MMKKLISVTAIAAGVMFTGQAFAATAGFAASTQLTPINCPALSNNITVQLSKDVKAGFNCGQVSFLAATCHATGTNKAQTVAPQWVDDGTGTGTMKIADGYTNCTDTDGDGTEDACQFQGRVGFRGTSQGGQVGAAPLGDTLCDLAGVQTLVPDGMLADGDVSGTVAP